MNEDRLKTKKEYTLFQNRKTDTVSEFGWPRKARKDFEEIQIEQETIIDRKGFTAEIKIFKGFQKYISEKEMN